MIQTIILFLIIVLITIVSSVETCEGNLVWYDCASPCVRTCAKPGTGFCLTVCVSKCSCPPETPILLDSKTCGTLADCVVKTNLPSAAPSTAPSKGKTCNDYDGKKSCLANPHCQWQRNRGVCVKRKN